MERSHEQRSIYLTSHTHTQLMSEAKKKQDTPERKQERERENRDA